MRGAQITDRIIAAAIRVHRILGPGFLEGIYEEGLAVEFALSGIQFVRQKPIDIHFAIGRSYLKATNLQDGLLLNFATTPLTIKRFCRERSEASPDFRS